MTKVLKIPSNRQAARYGFVLPRYYHGIAGGAETLSAALAQKLAARGDKVEVLTTCAKDNRTFENFFPEGSTKEGGITVSRFPVDQRNLDKWIPNQISISQGMRLSLDDQLEWMEHGVNSEKLYKEIYSRENQFDAIFFAPYLFATTLWGALMVPEKAVLIPCLHDECYAYQDVIASMFRQVRGVLYNADAEKRLATKLYGHIKGGEVGMGFEPYNEGYTANLERYFKDDFPYVLYLGRKETGKNVHELIDNFISSKNSSRIDSNLKLIILGGGEFSDLHRPDALLRDDIIDLAYLSEREKQSVLRYATVLCQPSVNESFSIVLMEAWLLGRPVLVNASCPVTKEHVVESGGGLFYGNEREFTETLALFCNASLGNALGGAGCNYVKKKYNWGSVINRFDKVMRDIFRVSEGEFTSDGRSDSKQDSRAS